MPSVNPITLHQILKARKNFQINESSCVANVDYDQEAQILTIEFQARGTYKYSEVPLDVYVDFSTAGSQGKYFNNYIRDQYSYDRIS